MQGSLHTFNYAAKIRVRVLRISMLRENVNFSWYSNLHVIRKHQAVLSLPQWRQVNRHTYNFQEGNR